jgi:hypothetical protein
MSEYSLLDGQKELLRKMAGAYDKTRKSGFMIVNNSTFTGVVFEAANGLREEIECDLVDINALNSEGLISLLSRHEGRLEAHSIDVIRANFTKPQQPPSTVLANNFVQGNVSGGTLQEAFGDHAKQTGSVSFGSIVAELKRTGIAQDQRNELENMMDEWPVASPTEKPSILQRFSDWCGRNSGNLGEFTGRALKGFFGSDT